MSAQPQLRPSSEAFESDAMPKGVVRMKVKQRADDDDRGTIIVLTSDPFQSLTPRTGERRASGPSMNVAPSSTVSYRWNKPASEAQPAPAMRITSAVAPAPQPAAQPKAQRGNARDAWCAVALMGMFIAGGIAWTNNRLADDQSMISGLQTQLADATSALDKKIEQIKQLYARVTDAENEAAKAKSALAQAKKR